MTQQEAQQSLAKHLNVLAFSLEDLRAVVGQGMLSQTYWDKSRADLTTGCIKLLIHLYMCADVPKSLRGGFRQGRLEQSRNPEHASAKQ